MKTYLSAIAVILILLPAGLASAEPGVFGAAVDDFRAGRYAEAVEKLGIAGKELPEVEDYILLYTSRSYSGMGNTEEALQTVKKLLAVHPESPLRQAALNLEIENTTDEEKALGLLESYIKEYPEDYEKKYSLGTLLKKRGSEEKAKALFKDIYISGSSISMKAHNELSPADIGPEDLLKRGANLSKAYRFAEAEKTLREALPGEKGALREDISRELGLSLFRQKKYREAAEVYSEASDIYNAARSFYRAGDTESFARALQCLASMEDKRASGLLILYASDKRRKGDTEEALKMLSEAMVRYPSHRAELLWSAAWTHYINKEHEKALGLFDSLYKTYNDSRYLYWTARVSEKTGKDPSDLFMKLREKDDYYGALASLKTGQAKTVKTVAVKAPKGLDYEKGSLFLRFDMLMDAGLEDEAVSELTYTAQRLKEPDSIIGIAFKLKALGRYRAALTLTTRLPGEMQPQELLYPEAYWPLVKEASEEHGINPYLILSVIREESRFDPEAYSPQGAAGLMQLMPETAGRISKALKMPPPERGSITEAALNIKLGSYYLSMLIKEFGSVFTALAAYNAGEHNVKKWLAGARYDSYDEFIEDIPFFETKNYIKRIITTYHRYQNSAPRALQ